MSNSRLARNRVDRKGISITELKQHSTSYKLVSQFQPRALRCCAHSIHKLMTTEDSISATGCPSPWQQIVSSSTANGRMMADPECFVLHAVELLQGNMSVSAKSTVCYRIEIVTCCVHSNYNRVFILDTSSILLLSSQPLSSQKGCTFLCLHLFLASMPRSFYTVCSFFYNVEFRRRFLSQGNHLRIRERLRCWRLNGS